ncbi:MAG: hypothetical protein K2L34_02735 [Muribaculaceae bacterium]|nr:hypothetical protein [Muribaculaceae bacterium]
MNKYIKYLTSAICLASLLIQPSCSDSDGEGEFEWTGSQNPENTSYRNPVWEPSLAGGTVFKSASSFNAISQETQWATGLDYACPSLQSSDLMNWSTNQQAFSYPVENVNAETGETVIEPGSRPEWITGEINQVSADFARTLAGANYWMLYSCDADNAFGAATAPSGLGPYTDLGCFLSADDLGVSSLRYPHFSVIASTNYYLGYTTENGSYLQALTLRKGNKPTLKGSPDQVSGAGFSNICIFRLDKDNFYLFGTVTNGNSTEIRYGKASKVTGPYLDKNGNELTSGASNGELLVKDGLEYVNPENPMRLFESENGYYYLAYNATDASRKLMPSGYERKPLFLDPLQMDEDGWFTTVTFPSVGWTTPRYQ